MRTDAVAGDRAGRVPATEREAADPVSEGKGPEALAVDTIRTLAMDAVQKANSGHPGTPMALAPAGHYLALRVSFHYPLTEVNALPVPWVEAYRSAGLMLADPVFADYAAAYGRGGLRAIEHDAITYLSRLYWYTV